MLSAAILHADTLLPDDLVSSGIIDEACRDEMDESEFESFDRLFSQLPAMKGEYIDMTCTLYNSFVSSHSVPQGAIVVAMGLESYKQSLSRHVCSGLEVMLVTFMCIATFVYV